MRSEIRLLFFTAVIPLTAAQPSQEPAVFHSGTRLVEVEVIVRGQPVRPPGLGASLKYILDSGPPFGPPGALVKGLTQDDFPLLDEGKPQRIAVFRAGASDDAKPVALPPGAVSNRQDSRGRPLNSATSVLVDFLNTDFAYTGYERMGMTKLLRSLAETHSRIALYTLGENLHMLHDFTDDPQKLTDAAAKLDQKPEPSGLASALRDYGDLLDLGREEVHGRMTVKALKLIVQHLSGVPGRKSLVWFMDDPRNVPPAVMALLQQANIVLYPVLVRLVRGESGGPTLGAARALAAVTGGRAFADALDLTFAVRTAEEDAGTGYILGYYPAENILDGKYHTITVELHNKAPDKQALEVRYRPGYLATKTALATPSPAPGELFGGPVVSVRIGLAAQVTPETQHPGLYDLRLTVDLHDIHLELKDGHFIGAFDVSVPNPSSKGTINTGTVAVNLTDEQLAETLENGFNVSLTGARSQSDEIRVVVRDQATGIAGSLRIPIPKPEGGTANAQ
jgi:Ca-activated chloride channel homolog